ncbi:MAG: carboxypeptidase-like regulatory domain-containing protein [Burkholderiaceae bacterium]
MEILVATFDLSFHRVGPSYRRLGLSFRRSDTPASPARILAATPGGTARGRTAAMTAAIGLAAAFALLGGCASTDLPPGPQYQAATATTDAEYQPFLRPGTNVLEGRAVRKLPDGRPAPVIGRSVTLDPATTIGDDWWRVAGRSFADRLSLPQSEAFARARRVTVTDGEGRFVFRDLPAGSYYLRTDYGGTATSGAGAQGGLLGQRVVVPVAAPVLVDSLAE